LRCGTIGCVSPNACLFLLSLHDADQRPTLSPRLSRIPLRSTSSHTSAMLCGRPRTARNRCRSPSTSGPAKSPKTGSWKYGSRQGSPSQTAQTSARAASLAGTTTELNRAPSPHTLHALQQTKRVFIPHSHHHILPAYERAHSTHDARDLVHCMRRGVFRLHMSLNA
jgi:hypothetical protein